MDYSESAVRLRITKVDEYQFLTCIKKSLWGSKTARFKDWKKGDLLVISVNKSLAAYAEVSGQPFHSKEVIWDDGLFPYRIPIKFIHVLAKNDRIPILGEIRDILVSEWATNNAHYGWGILNQTLIEDSSAERIIEAITQKPNVTSETISNMDQLLMEADQLRKDYIPLKKEKIISSKEMDSPVIPAEAENLSTEEESIHTKTQAMLIKLGKITGCSVWVAANDKNRTIQGTTLGEQCLKQLPNLGLNEEATRKIELIDVIWFKQNAPVCAFEVEATTSIYSGILRMSDLISLVPALRVKLYIVASRDRQGKVSGELNRPTFRKIGLNDFCKFIPIEELKDLISKVEGFGGHIQPTIVDKIAIEYGENI